MLFRTARSKPFLVNAVQTSPPQTLSMTSLTIQEDEGDGVESGGKKGLGRGSPRVREPGEMGGRRRGVWLRITTGKRVDEVIGKLWKGLNLKCTVDFRFNGLASNENLTLMIFGCILLDVFNFHLFSISFCWYIYLPYHMDSKVICGDRILLHGCIFYIYLSLSI